jgi:hypothetical protein
MPSMRSCDTEPCSKYEDCLKVFNSTSKRCFCQKETRLVGKDCLKGEFFLLLLFSDINRLFSFSTRGGYVFAR